MKIPKWFYHYEEGSKTQLPKWVWFYFISVMIIFIAIPKADKPHSGNNTKQEQVERRRLEETEKTRQEEEEERNKPPEKIEYEIAGKYYSNDRDYLEMRGDFERGKGEYYAIGGSLRFISVGKWYKGKAGYRIEFYPNEEYADFGWGGGTWYPSSQMITANIPGLGQRNYYKDKDD